ncbi:hypothetical protein CCACVL1_17983 [Corchorus capsularis]|uniref:Uncharacterized protein n=1 Tax=Corchorus capsularis TaxID=210143 RepID=A0A1R3HNZ7_COCAP|nr:hypothetical protein CCACVL1_17983 [Corchorus capsularis]
MDVDARESKWDYSHYFVGHAMAAMSD